MFGGGEGPIDITSNRLDIDDTDKTATFTGNVKARQGDAAMATAALEVQYEGGETGAAGSAPAATTPGAGTKIKRIVLQIARDHDARAAGPRHRRRASTTTPSTRWRWWTAMSR